MLHVLAHRQNRRHHAHLARLGCLCQHFRLARRRHLAADQIRHRTFRQFEAPLRVILENRHDALKADGEAARAHVLAAEFADHLVVASAARDGEIVAVQRHLENRAGVIAHAAHKRRVKDDLHAVREHRLHAAHNVRQRRADVFRQIFAAHACAEVGNFHARLHVAVERHVFFHLFRRISAFQQILFNAVEADLVKLVQRNQRAADFFLLKARRKRRCRQHPAVVDVDGELVHVHFGENLAEHRRRRGNQLDLGQAAVVAQNVDVALGKLTEASLLRVVRAPDVTQLHRLKRRRQFLLVVRVVARQRHGQVIAQAIVRQFAVALFNRTLELRAALHHLEDELFVVAALLAGQVLDVLHHRRFNLHETVCAVGFLDHAEHMLAKAHVGGKHIAHALDGRFDEFHNRISFRVCSFSRGFAAPAPSKREPLV